MSLSTRLVALALVSIALAGVGLAVEKATQTNKPETTQEPTEELFKLIDPAMLKEAATDDEIRKLMKARYSNAALAVEMKYMMYLGGRIDLQIVLEAGKDSVAAALDLCQNSKEKVAVLEKLVKVTKHIEELTKLKGEGGQANQSDIHTAQAKHLDAQIQLLRAKQEMAKSK